MYFYIINKIFSTLHPVIVTTFEGDRIHLNHVSVLLDGKGDPCFKYSNVPTK